MNGYLIRRDVGRTPTDDDTREQDLVSAWCEAVTIGLLSTVFADSALLDHTVSPLLQVRIRTA